MNTKAISMMVRVSTDAPDAHRIHLRWPVTIKGSGFLEVARRLECYTNLQDVRAKGYAIINLPLHSSVQFLSALPAWTMPSMLEPTQDLHCFQMHAIIKVSAPLVTYSRTRAKLPTLVLPSQIDFAGCTDIIRRTLEVSYFALSLYSGEGWLEMRRSHYVLLKAQRALRQH